MARAEVDLWLLRDADGMVDHDGRIRIPGRGDLPIGQVDRREVLGIARKARPALLSELVEVVRRETYPTRIEIDLKDELPWPHQRVDEILGRLAPIRERVTLAGCNDETLRRLAAADRRLSIGFNPSGYLDWLPAHRRAELTGAPAADGWLNRTGARARRHQIATLRSLVPAAEELHLRMEAFERLILEAAVDAIDELHGQGWSLDVWTLDAGTERWQPRMQAAVAAGVDMITTNTAPELARAYRESKHRSLEVGPG